MSEGDDGDHLVESISKRADHFSLHKKVALCALGPKICLKFNVSWGLCEKDVGDDDFDDEKKMTTDLITLGAKVARISCEESTWNTKKSLMSFKSTNTFIAKMTQFPPNSEMANIIAKVSKVD